MRSAPTLPPPRPLCWLWPAIYLLAAVACSGDGATGSLGGRRYTAGNCPLTDACQTAGRLQADGTCAYDVLADGTPCGESNVCIADASCLGGRCVGVPAQTCRARGPCFLDNACDPARGCVDVPLDGPCVPDLAPLTLAGCSTADYAAPVSLGGTTMELIVDSGSTTVAAASSLCTQGCEGLSPVYTPGSDVVLGAKTASQYGDGSAWAGQMVADTLQVPILSAPAPFTFVAMTYASLEAAKTSAFFTASTCTGSPVYNTRQGILGLGNLGLRSEATATVLMDLLAKKGLGNAFASQFCNLAGRLWLGGYDPAYVDSALSWAPLTGGSEGYYEVRLDDLLVDGDSLGATADDLGRSIVDNGTSNLNVPADVYNAVLAALGANLKFTAQFPITMFTTARTCLAPAGNLPRVELDKRLPSFSLVVAGAAGPVHIDLAPTSSYLMYSLDAQGNDAYCPSLGNTGVLPASGDVSTLIGNSTMRDHIVVVDRDGQQVGWAAQKNCIGSDL